MSKKSAGNRKLLRTKIAVAAGLCAFVASVAAFGFWARDSGDFTARELEIVRQCSHAWPAVIFLARVATVVFLPPLTAIYLLAILIFAMRRAKNLAVIARESVAIAAPLAFALALKVVVARPRPSTLGRILPGFSFPSGHVACAAVVALALIWLADSYAREKRNFGANFLRTLVLVIPVLVAVSRVVIGAHYPSDVVASLVATPVIYFATRFLLRPKSENLAH